MDDTAKALRDAIRAADTDLRDVEKLQSDAERAAIDQVRAFYRGDIQDARQILAAAEKAERDHIDSQSSHPWEGRRVFFMIQKTARWSGHVIGEERLEGLVEVVRQGSDFPANLSRDSRPPLGKVIVRKIKKDGAAALHFYDYPTFEHWKLVEDPPQQDTDR